MTHLDPEHISAAIARIAKIIPPHICPKCGHRRGSQQCKHSRAQAAINSGNARRITELEQEIQEIER